MNLDATDGTWVIPRDMVIAEKKNTLAVWFLKWHTRVVDFATSCLEEKS